MQALPKEVPVQRLRRQRERNKCVKCGGSVICPHGRIKSKCKDCGGAGVCVHDKLNWLCQECGGKSICEHSKIRSYCVNCKGGAICRHKKKKTNCKLCGGGSICPHGIRRSTCVPCGGEAFANIAKCAAIVSSVVAATIESVELKISLPKAWQRSLRTRCIETTLQNVQRSQHM